MKNCQDLSNVYFDLETVRREIQGLSDIELYDYCISDIDLHKREDLDQLYDKLAGGGKLTSEERKELESFYTLVSLEFLANE
jgi:hypothetical protein